MTAGITLTQASFTNWAQGGQNALAYTLLLNGRTQQVSEETYWSTSYSFAYGQAQFGDGEVRRTEDRIDLLTVYTFRVGAYVNPYIAASLKTQFALGYKYDTQGGAEPVSRFFDPGYLTQSAGAGYQPLPELKQRVGFALREVFTSRFRSYADDPGTPKIEKVKVDGGLESATELEWEMDEDLLFRSKLELFSPFRQPGEIVLRSDHTLSVKVSKLITVNLNVQVIHEKEASPRTQLRESLAIGMFIDLL
jgi:hypothetical protein